MNLEIVEAIKAMSSEYVDGESVLRTFGRRFPLPDFDAIRALLFRDQIYWWPLLPVGMTGDAVLVLESRLGGLSIGLAEHYDEVVSVHASEAAAEVTRLRIAAEGIRGIRVTVCASVESLLEPTRSYAAVVMYDLEGDPTGQWRELCRDFTATLIGQSGRLIRQGGAFLLTARNRWSYRVILRGLLASESDEPPGRCWSLLGAGRAIARTEFGLVDCFLSNTELESGVPHSLGYYGSKGQSIQRALPGESSVQIKDLILRSRIGRLFWPTFMVTAARRSTISNLASLVEVARVREKCGWPDDAQIEVKRLVAGNENTTVMLVGTDSGMGEDVVIRLPSSGTGEALCRTNAMMLSSLGSMAPNASVPRLVAEGVFCRYYYSIESRCPGIDVSQGRMPNDAMVVNAVEEVRALWAKHTVVKPLGSADVEQWTSSLVHFAVDHVTRIDLRERLHTLQLRLADALDGQYARVGLMHGDFKMSNLLFDCNRKVAAIIDWDHGRRLGLPLFDLLQLVLFRVIEEGQVEFVKAYRDYVLPWHLPFGWGGRVIQVVGEDAMDRRVFAALRVLHVFYSLHYRLGPAVAKHASWQTAFMEPLLSSCEELMQVASPSTGQIASGEVANGA